MMVNELDKDKQTSRIKKLMKLEGEIKSETKI